MESRYKPCQYIGISRIQMCQWSPVNPNLLSILVEKGWSWIAEQVVTLITENKKTILPFRLTNRRRLNLHMKHSTKCEKVVKIQDTKVANVWSKDHVNDRKNLLVPQSVANPNKRLT
jgi:hypothetical protein